MTLLRDHALRGLSQEDRIAAQVERGMPDECWLFTGPANDRGYGQFWMHRRQRGAHRVAYESWVGPIPDGLHVLHRCDNPPCCNPAHLFVGTHADNMSDKAAKGRSHRVNRPGENNPMHKLTDEQVAAIRDLGKSGGWTNVALARRFAVHPSTVSKILHGHRWRQSC